MNINMNMNLSLGKQLYNLFEGKPGKITKDMLIYLFGYYNWTDDMKKNYDDTHSLFQGLYKGLYLLNIPYTEIDRCMDLNMLDEMFHIKYSIRSSGYYRNFCKKNIKIGKTSLIADEDIFTYKKYLPKIYDLKPSFEDDNGDDNGGDIEDDIIKAKIKSYKEQDKKKSNIFDDDYISVDDVKELLEIQEGKCYICCDKVINKYWEKGCLYQFTLDRIDNNKNHTRDNCLISCYFCNCYSGSLADKFGANENTRHKICKNGCHIEERNDIRNREHVSIEEKNYLKLK
jgi:hypothetical protein